MNSELSKKLAGKKKRKIRVRKRLRGDAQKPRLCVIKSNKHLFAQVINDEEGKTIFGFGTCSKELKTTQFNKKSMEAAKHLGTLIGQKAKENKIDQVVFDRGSNKYHGLIAELANAAREAGLQF